MIRAGCHCRCRPADLIGAAARPFSPAQLSGKIDWAQAGRADGWTDVTHFTHQKPRRPGATIRAG